VCAANGDGLVYDWGDQGAFAAAEAAARAVAAGVAAAAVAAAKYGYGVVTEVCDHVFCISLSFAFKR
jgi:hypothetical protein